MLKKSILIIFIGVLFNLFGCGGGGGGTSTNASVNNNTLSTVDFSNQLFVRDGGVADVSVLTFLSDGSGEGYEGMASLRKIPFAWSITNGKLDLSTAAGNDNFVLKSKTNDAYTFRINETMDVDYKKAKPLKVKDLDGKILSFDGEAGCSDQTFKFTNLKVKRQQVCNGNLVEEEGTFKAVNGLDNVLAVGTFYLALIEGDIASGRYVIIDSPHLTSPTAVGITNGKIVSKEASESISTNANTCVSGQNKLAEGSSCTYNNTVFTCQSGLVTGGGITTSKLTFNDVVIMCK